MGCVWVSEEAASTNCRNEKNFYFTVSFKKIIMKLNGLLITVALFMIAASGCKPKTAENLVINKWQLTEMKGKDSQIIPDTVKARMYNDASIEFMKDGKYQTIGMGVGIQKGTYKLANGGKTLITIDDTGIPDSLVVVELTTGKLSLKVAKADVQISFKTH